MKLILTSILFFVFGNQIIISQELGQDTRPVPKVIIGIRVGATINTFTNIQLNSANERKALNIGIHGGLIIKGNLKDNIVLQGELLFNERGQARRSTSTNLNQRISSKIYYIDLPILFKYYVGKSTVRFYAGTGPQIGIGLKQRTLTKLKFNSQTERNATSLEWPDTQNRLAVLWLIDMGMHVAFDNGKQLEVGIRPQLGLNNLFKSSLNINSKPMGIMLTAAYHFGK